MLKDLFQEQKSYLNAFFDQLDIDQAERFFEEIKKCTGTLFFSGVGKSGLVARRLAQMLMSVGVKAHFLSATDALHGDLGAVSQEDLFIALSKSGESEELLTLAPYLKSKVKKLLALVCYENSKLEKWCDLTVKLPLEKELCPFDLAPATSSAIQMIFGDILVVAMMHERGFSKEQYAKNHPSGLIGKRLVLRVEDLMLKGKDLPLAFAQDALMDALVTLSDKRCGCLLVVDENQKLCGLFTDGDLRRTLQLNPSNISDLCLSDVMTKAPTVAHAEDLAYEALKIMQKIPGAYITELPVVDKQGCVLGLIRLHQIAEAGLCAG